MECSLEVLKVIRRFQVWDEFLLKRFLKFTTHLFLPNSRYEFDKILWKESVGTEALPLFVWEFFAPPKLCLLYLLLVIGFVLIDLEYDWVPGTFFQYTVLPNAISALLFLLKRRLVGKNGIQILQHGFLFLIEGRRRLLHQFLLLVLQGVELRFPFVRVFFAPILSFLERHFVPRCIL